ncbi:hypothetical protein BED47_00890 [Gottfriedia luciferensis]|uniref:Uncharacterized protein n=1 Tax=Gottfriedia luciferensis TaxID=178774 RepID=A0ABX2ZWI1_9BACI|nr:hypothetical protein [Gottfriedia luciferensis]ODG93757.1 hypothetical protein BED47_00890 [Gottfriedia luciferensis]
MKKIDPTIIIFIITLLGYALVTFFSLGYKDFYGLPSDLVEITISKIAITSVFTLMVISVGFIYNLYLHSNTSINKFIISPSVEQLKKIKNIYVNKIIEYTLFTAILLTILCLYFGIFKINFYSIYSLMLILAMDIYFIIKRYFKVSMVFFLICLGYFISYLGYNSAASKQTYLTIKNENLIVIDYYKDTAIVAKVDLDKKLIYPEFQFIKLESTDKSPQKLVLKHTGELRMSK